MLVPSREKRLRARGVKSYLFTRELPAESFYRVHDGLFVESPAMLFVRLAPRLTPTRRILLGMELCGTYSIAPGARGGIRSRHEICSPEEIRSTIDTLGRVDGKQLAKRVVGDILVGAASPFESKAALLLSLPRSKGGYELSGLELNHVVDLPRGVWPMTRCRQYRIDLFWPSAQVGLECESRAFHAADERLAADSARREVLLSLGLTTHALTWGMVADWKKLDWEARELAGLLGKRIPPSDNWFRGRQCELRGELGLP